MGRPSLPHDRQEKMSLIGFTLHPPGLQTDCALARLHSHSSVLSNLIGHGDHPTFARIRKHVPPAADNIESCFVNNIVKSSILDTSI